MTQVGEFDPTFDFRTETPSWEEDPDPDRYSPTLRKYHKLLWNKPLPNDDLFDLDINRPLPHLRLKFSGGELNLTSDSASPTWMGVRWRRWWRQWDEVIPFIPKDELEEFFRTAHRIGNKMLFPSTRRDGMNSINQERGVNSQICDRLDLTLECIRLHYLHEDNPQENPLADVLIRYEDFFELFEDFRGFTDFFLLQDIVSEDAGTVKFLMPFTGFGVSPLPDSVEAYQHYRENAIRVVEARNLRMFEYVARL